LEKALEISVKTINWIRIRVLNHCLFRSLCEDFHTDFPHRRPLALTWKSFNPLVQTAWTNQGLSGGTSCDLLEELES